MRDPYTILGLAKTASAAEIKSAFRKLAKKYHPDQSKEPKAKERFAEIGQAGGKRRVLPGGGVGQCAPRRVRHLRGPRADDARSGRGGPARLRGVYQDHLSAERILH